MKFRLVIGILLIVGCVISFVIGMDAQRDVMVATEWQSVGGAILKSELIVDKLTYPEQYTPYYPKILYTYQVDGKEYSCDNIVFGGVTSGKHSKMYERYVERYPIGSSVRVYYNPKEPENAVLEPQETWGFKKYYILASFLAVCGIFFVINYFTGFGEGLLLVMEH